MGINTQLQLMSRKSIRNLTKRLVQGVDKGIGKARGSRKNREYSLYQTVEDLTVCLRNCGLDPTLYGIGTAKSVEALLKEYNSGKIELVESYDSKHQRKLERTVTVVNLIVNGPDGVSTLIERSRTLANGLEKHVNRKPSTLLGESQRALSEKDAVENAARISLTRDLQIPVC